MALLDEFCDSAFWDSNLTWHSANPDFTSCFKNTALVWIPCIFLWVLAPIEIYFIKSTKSRNIPYGLSSNVKLVFIVFIVALNLIETVDYAIFDTAKSIRIFNSALKLTTYVLFFSLILANIKRGIRRSGILSTFALLSVICGIPQFRTFIVQGFVISYNDHDITDSISYLLQYMSIFIILILSYFADSESNYSSCSTNQNVCPSHNASYASKIFLSWYSRYVWRNVKKPIENNLWELHEEDRAINESFKLEKYLNKFPYRTRYEDVDGPNKESKSNMFGDENNFSTLKLLFDRYRWPIFIGALWRALDAWMIVNYPILFSLLISYTHETETPWKMYLCAFGFVVNAVADSVVMARYYEGLTKMQIRIRAALISLIYKKILRTSERVRRAYTSGEIVNLMTVDITRILDMTIFMHYLWLTPFQFILSFYFVWKTFGLCTIVSIIMMILLMPINKYLFTIMMKYVDDETMYRDRRGKFIQDLLNGVKILKMYAWEASFERKATSLRQEETNILKKSGILHVWLLFMYNCIPIMMSVISFAAYNIFTGSSIDVDKAFITISFFNTFRTPLRLMSNYFPSMMQALISLKRIDDFLNLPEPNDTAISHDPVDAALVMENATFSWTALEGSTVLHDLNLRVNKGSLISIVGCVGAGKSSLISAFLGEMKKLSGYVNVNGNIAYVPQQAWILNATLRDNITLGQPIDRFLYKSALKACALDRDLSNFPAGDLMEIGERGINLSGGQKQRITIARAICCNADIYFFDDSLSAVDVRVADHIFQCVLGPNGILNQKTRVLVTHNTTFLSQSDQVIVLKDGGITESGSYQDLITKGGYLTTFLAHEARNMKEDGDDFRNKPKENCFEENKLLTLRDTNNEDIITTDTKLIEKDNVATSSVKREVYKFYLSIIGIPIIFYVLTLNVFNQIFSLSSRLWLTSWSSANALEENSYSQTFYLSIFAAFGLTEALSAAIANRLLLKGIYDATSTIYNQMISSVLKWPLWLLDSTPVGRIMNRATSDIHILDTIACKRSVAFLELGHRFLFILLILCYIMPINILIFTSVFVTVYFFQHRYQSLNSQLKRINFNNMAPLSSFIVETIHGLSSIRANRFQKKFIAMLYEKVDLYSSGMLPTGTCYRWCTIRLESLYGFAVFLVIVLILRQKDILGHGMVCFAISYAIQWTKEFQWFLCYLTELHDSTISVERIKEYIDLPQENIDKKSQAIPTRWPHRGEIQFQNYKLRYRQCDDMVLKGLTFSIKSGEKIGIIGRTGAGKSSLILGLLRLVEPADGTIIIDNIDIRHLDLKILRSRLTIIPQDPVLFLGTLRFNLDPMEKHPDESLWNALKKAHLKQFVKDLPNGLEYHIDEGGENLSCGQKQLLCLARALLRKSKILILDEATASVDIETDELIQNTIRTEFNQCTVLTVAHRVHTVQDYDRILVMEAGRVIEYDTPENLLNKKNSSLFYKVMLKSGLITQ